MAEDWPWWEKREAKFVSNCSQTNKTKVEMLILPHQETGTTDDEGNQSKIFWKAIYTSFWFLCYLRSQMDKDLWFWQLCGSGTNSHKETNAKTTTASLILLWMDEHRPKRHLSWQPCVSRLHQRQGRSSWRSGGVCPAARPPEPCSKARPGHVSFCPTGRASGWLWTAWVCDKQNSNKPCTPIFGKLRAAFLFTTGSWKTKTDRAMCSTFNLSICSRFANSIIWLWGCLADMHVLLIAQSYLQCIFINCPMNWGRKHGSNTLSQPFWKIIKAVTDGHTLKMLLRFWKSPAEFCWIDRRHLATAPTSPISMDVHPIEERYPIISGTRNSGKIVSG